MGVSDELFLLSCINNSNNGKVDYKAVAAECDMPTPNAANMRLSRFKKKHTAELNGGSVANSPAPETPVKEKKQAKKGGTKKRKLSEAEPEATVEDDNETLAVETPVKQEAKDEED